MADENTQSQNADEGTADINDSGTKGTGSAGAQADDEDDEGAANINDAGTKGTGSAG